MAVHSINVVWLPRKLGHDRSTALTSFQQKGAHHLIVALDLVHSCGGGRRGRRMPYHEDTYEIQEASGDHVVMESHDQTSIIFLISQTSAPVPNPNAQHQRCERTSIQSIRPSQHPPKRP